MKTQPNRKTPLGAAPSRPSELCKLLYWVLLYGPIWGFPKIRGTFVGVPMPHAKDYYIFWGIYCLPLENSRRSTMIQRHRV